MAGGKQNQEFAVSDYRNRFCNRERDLAIASKHLCPSMLAEELAKLKRPTQIFITHLKPNEIDLTMREVEECAGKHKPEMLLHKKIFVFIGGQSAAKK